MEALKTRTLAEIYLNQDYLVRTPKNLTKRQEELLRKFEELGREEEKGKEGWKRSFKGENKSQRNIYP